MVSNWEQVTALPGLAEGEVQVWRIDLAEADETEDRYLRHLAADEVDRAGRLRVGQVRMQFVVGRACLRVLLGCELGVDPTSVPIVLGRYGKPETAAVAGSPLFFNVAHSRSTVLIAICRMGALGIDVEYVDRHTNVMEVARHSLTANEHDSLLSIADGERRTRAFFRCWTRKEAVVKADGRGLSLALSAFEVSFDEADAASPIVVRIKEAESLSLYYVCDIALEDGITSSVAVKSQRLPVRILKFPVSLLHDER